MTHLEAQRKLRKLQKTEKIVWRNYSRISLYGVQSVPWYPLALEPCIHKTGLPVNGKWVADGKKMTSQNF